MHGELTSEILPWLVRHGEVLGYVIASLMVLAGGLAGLRVLRSRDLLRAARRRSSLGRPRSTVDDEPGAFVGVLEADGTTQRFDDGAPCAVAMARIGAEQSIRRAARLRLRMKEATVDLEGPLDIVVGSEERRFLSADTRIMAIVARTDSADERRTVTSSTEWKVGSLQPGDRVVARGTIAREADGGAERDYRSAPERLVLRPGPSGVIELATSDTPRVTPRTYDAYAAMVSGGILGFAFFWAVGAWGLDSIPTDGQAPPSISLSAQLATVSPIHRGRAIDRLTDLYIESPGPWDLRRAATALALSPDSCRDPLLDGIGVLADDDFVDIALRCGRRRMAARRLAARGDFDRASELLASDDIEWTGLGSVSPRSSGFVHLLAGEPERAAAAARQQADLVEASSIVPGRAQALRCLAIALETRAGPEGRAQLAEAMTSAEGPVAAHTCGLLHAVANDDAEAGARELASVSQSHQTRSLAALLLAARGEWPRSLQPTRWFTAQVMPAHNTAMSIGILEQALGHPPPLSSLRLDDAERTLSPVLFYIATGSVLANVQSRLGDGANARATLRQIAPYIERLEGIRDELENGPPIVRASTQGALADARMMAIFVAVREGDYAEAERILEDTSALADELPEYWREAAEVARVAAAAKPPRERLTPWIRSTNDDEVRNALVEAALVQEIGNSVRVSTRWG